MDSSRIILPFLVCSLIFPAPAPCANERAIQIVRDALRAQGGEAKLRAIRSVRWEGMGYRNQLEESERPEGPYITEFTQQSELHDYEHGRYRSVITMTVNPLPPTTRTTVVEGDAAMRVSGERQVPGTMQQVRAARAKLALSPERLLLTAVAANDLQSEDDTTLQGVPHHVVHFTLDGSKVRILVNANTHLPTAVDDAGPLAHSGFWAYLGDVQMRTFYGFWWLAKGGVHLPLQWNVEMNGLPDSMLAISRIQIDGPLNDGDLTIPDAIRAACIKNPGPASPDEWPLGNPAQPASELAPGIVLIPGPWNITIIRQDGGIVILEAPISSGYSAKVIQEAKRRFPDLPIRAVITTSDSWPHLAGVREYVATGIPVYALDLNRPILERLIADRRVSKPDTLARLPHKADWRWVGGPVAIGAGPNRLEIYPIRGETSERQMLVYFPEHKLLYGSDPFQPDRQGGFFYPQTVSELVDAVAKEKLIVESFFMMHSGLTLWTELGKTITRAIESDSPPSPF